MITIDQARRDLEDVVSSVARVESVRAESLEFLAGLRRFLADISGPPNDGLAFALSEIVRTAQGVDGADREDKVVTLHASVSEVLGLMRAAAIRIESDAAEIAELRGDLRNVGTR